MALTTGTRLGTYEILSPLGAGGMGEVYRARDTRLGRDVAIKVLPAEVPSHPDRLARFEREAKTVAALNHPNIVTLYSLEEAGGIRFLTMELVEGETLGRLVTPGGLPLARAVGLAIPLSDALVAAHEKGVVHRDLKPANVIVTREGRVKVLDFGLAKLAASESSLDATQAATLAEPISSAGQVVGTVPYMAPEQVRGDTVDARTDLFALGILVYELLAGRRPFSGATAADVSSAILRDPPTPLRSLRTDLPPDLDRIVGRCLEKDPERRFQTAKDVRNELELVRRALDSGVGSPSAPSHASSAGLAREIPSVAVLPFVNMSRDEENEYFSDGLAEELLNVLAKSPGLKVTGRTSSFAFKGKQEDLREIGHKLGVAAILEGSVRKAGNRVRITTQLIKVSDGFHLWSETYDRVVDDIFAVQDEIARSVSAALHVTLLGQPAAVVRGGARDYERVLQAKHLTLQCTRAAEEQAVLLFTEVLAGHPENAVAWAGLARAHSIQAGYGYGDAGQCARRAKEAAQKALALDDTLPDAHEVTGWVLMLHEYRWAEAAEAFRRAMNLAPGSGGALMAMATCEAFRGRLGEALPMARKAAEMDPLAPTAHAFLGRIEYLSGENERARASYARALELSPGHPQAHAMTGLTLILDGRLEEAIAEIQKEAAAGYRQCGLAIAYHAAGRESESKESLAALIREGDDWGVQIAMVHARRGESDEAFRWLERSYELRDTGVASVKVARTFETLHGDPRWPALMKKIGH